MKSKTHCTVVIHPPGDSHNRILIPAVELGANGSVEHAKAYALDAITALARLPQDQWRVHVADTSQVQDADPITDNTRTQA